MMNTRREKLESPHRDWGVYRGGYQRPQDGEGLGRRGFSAL